MQLLLIGYFEGIESERGIAWRAADSLALRDFHVDSSGDVLLRVLREHFVDQRLVPDCRRCASARSCSSTPGSSRIAIRRRGSSPSGGRPTRRIAFNCSGVDSGGAVRPRSRMPSLAASTIFPASLGHFSPKFPP
ncbi:MAG: hypothetical protein ACM3SQ_09755 [Betaproteobacteria bacterium]